MTSHEGITRAYTDPLGLAKDNLRRYRDALEEIAFREACLDPEADELRRVARRALGWTAHEIDPKTGTTSQRVDPSQLRSLSDD